jgi:hypothetical protein
MLMIGVVAIVLIYNSDQQTTPPTICSSNNTLKIIFPKRFQLGDKDISHTSVTSEFTKIIVIPKL